MGVNFEEEMYTKSDDITDFVCSTQKVMTSHCMTSCFSVAPQKIHPSDDDDVINSCVLAPQLPLRKYTQTPLVYYFVFYIDLPHFIVTSGRGNEHEVGWKDHRDGGQKHRIGQLV